MRARLAATALVCLTLTALLPAPAAAAPPSGWTLPWNLDTGASDVSQVHVVPLPNGGALAVWIGLAGGELALSYSEYIRGSGWQAPAQVNLWGTLVTSFSLAVNDGGFGVVAWWELVASYRAQASFFRPNEGFSPQAPIANNTSQPQAPPAAAIDAAGAVTVTFAELDGAVSSEFAVRGDAVSGSWSAAERIESDDTGDAFPIRGAVVATPSGDVHAFWLHSNASGDHFYSSKFTDGAGWGAPVRLDAMPSAAFQTIEAAALPDGRVVAVWGQPNATVVPAVAYSFYSPAAGWAAAPRELPTSPNGDYSPHIACGGPSTCVLQWMEIGNATERAMFALSSDAGASFAPAQDLDLSLEGGAVSAAAALNAAGDGVIVWSQEAAPPAGGSTHAQVSARRLSAASGLGPTERLDRISSETAGILSAAVSSVGELAVGWSGSDGPNTAGFAALFVPPDLTPPKLRVTAPLAGAVFGEASAVVTGNTDPGASVSVNGQLALVRPDGSFALRVPLPYGNSTIRVIAWDQAGNNETLPIPVSVTGDPSAAAAEIGELNLTIALLKENVTTVEENLNSTIALVLILQNYLNTTNQSWAATQSALNESQNQTATANTNATTSYQLAWNTQQDLGRTQGALNNTTAQVSSAQSAAGSAMMVGVIGAIAGIAGVAVGLMSGRTRGSQIGAPKKSFAQRDGGGGGGGGAGGAESSFAINEQGVRTTDISRQTPKTDFGDRMKAGLDTADGSDAARGPRQTTSLDSSFDPSAEPVDAKYGQVSGIHRDEALGPVSGKRSSMAGEYAKDASASGDVATGQASGRNQSDVKTQREAASGQASGRSAPDTPAGEGPSKFGINEQGVPSKPTKKKP